MKLYASIDLMCSSLLLAALFFPTGFPDFPQKNLISPFAEYRFCLLVCYHWL
ncbi:hypothetical protein RchiOBHm_Chr5g0018931 [Rosa chinensis]|uniref:Uncharacterized protein n=1 Tax=Rosa chinensis TaxID=74649 RepID=A0A2P6Q6W5_ROSCH|nr:hypothetical protein RchiOBHm_Chr5g0018931 [Rosa chinensis]